MSGRYFEKAPKTVGVMVGQLVKKHYSDLVEADVTFDCAMAYHSKDGPPITVGGWPAKGKSKVTNLEQRVRGAADVEITVDGAAWKQWSDDERKAVIDRELCCLVVRREEDGIAKDDCGRPKLKRKEADFLVTGFDEMVERYGAISVEAQGINSVTARWVQAEFDFTGGGDPIPMRSAAKNSE